MQAKWFPLVQFRRPQNWIRLVVAFFFCLSVANPQLPTVAAEQEAPQANPWPRQNIGVIAVPNLTAADHVGQLLSDEFKRRFADSPQSALTLDVIHLGDLKDFPSELSWIINQAKHSETNPRINNSIEVELHLVNEREFSEALAQTQEEFDSALKAGVELAEKLNQTSQALADQIASLSRLADEMSNANSAPKGIATNTDTEFHQQLALLEERFSHFTRILRENPMEWLHKMTWQEFSSLRNGLQEFADFWGERAPLIYRLAHHPTSDAHPGVRLQERIDRLFELMSEAEKSKLLFERIALHLRYNPQLPLELASLVPNQTQNLHAPLAPPRFHRLSLPLRHFFGLPQGMSWIMYKLSFTERTAHEHVVEFSSAALQAMTLYGINYASIAAKLASEPETYLNPSAGAVVSAGWKLLTGYVERANNAFFVQGINYSPISEFTTNRPFFLLSAYAHSIIIGLTVQLAARGVDGLTLDIGLHTAWNSFLGLFAKAVPLLLISKHQQKHYEVEDTGSRRHSKWRTIAYNFLFNMFYQSLKAVHFYQLDFFDLDVVFVVLGLAGLAYEAGKWFYSGTQEVATRSGTMTRMEYSFNKFTRALSIAQVGSQKRTCRTLFLFPQPTRH